MSDPVTYKQPIAPVAVIFNRLNRDAAANKPLYGLKVKQAKLDWQTIGADDLPSISVDDLEFRDEIFAGAKPTPSSTGNVNMESACQIEFLIATHRDHGLYATSTAKKNGLLDWVTLISDAIERNDAGDPDAKLDGTCSQPLKIEGGNMAQADLCHFFVLTISYHPRPFRRSTRSDAMTVPYLTQVQADLAAPRN